MHVAGEIALTGDQFKATHTHVFTQLGNQGLTDIFNTGRVVIADRHRQQRFHVRRLFVQHPLGNRINKILEIITFRDEVGLTVNFGNDGLLAIVTALDYYQAFCCRTTRFLVRLGQAGFTHMLNGGLNITLGFDKRFLAFHHAGACPLTQFFYQCCRDCHV